MVWALCHHNQLSLSAHTKGLILLLIIPNHIQTIFLTTSEVLKLQLCMKMRGQLSSRAEEKPRWKPLPSLLCLCLPRAFLEHVLLPDFIASILLLLTTLPSELPYLTAS